MKPIVLALTAALLASCQSMSEGVLSLEARALALEDADEDLGGYGGHVALNTPIVDILVGADHREIGTLDATEGTLGLRRRFLEIWKLRPFVEANQLIGLDLFDDVSGWSAGGGALLHLNDHLFMNFRVMYEERSTSGLFVESSQVDGVVGTVGIGLSL